MIDALIHSPFAEVAVLLVMAAAIGLFAIPREPSEASAHAEDSYEVIVFGLGRFGTAIGMRLQEREIRVFGMDFNPMAVRRWREPGLDTEFGDATDAEFVSELPLSRADWIVSNVPIHSTNLSHEDTRITLIQLTRAAGLRGRVAVALQRARDTEELFGAGADILVEPFQDGADRAVDLLCGAPEADRTDIPSAVTEEKHAS
jgi:Trk K+ transport system NAD-binding subunit